MTPETEARLVAQLELHEDVVLMAYMDCCRRSRKLCDCAKPGALTIGAGHNLDTNAITRRASRMILEDDMREKATLCRRRLPWFDQQPEARQAALVECAFHGALFSSPRALQAMDRGDWIAAERELLDGPWVKIGNGNRQRRVARQIASGEWPA